MTRSAIHEESDASGFRVLTPTSLKLTDAQAEFADLALDAAVVAAYGLILPKTILEAPRLGCINVHASLLPRWRGAAPIQRAIQAGDTESGVTIMQMDEGLDTGGILLVGRTPITSTTTAGDLHNTLSAMGADLIKDTLSGLAAGTLHARPQPEHGATYAKKLLRDEGKLNWAQPAHVLERWVRALNPWPSVWFDHTNERIRVLRSKLSPLTGQPGTVLDDGDQLTVACGDGAITLELLQRQGRRPMPSTEFLRGYSLPAGTRLD
jgi:methionyl-tRNA formyltransferase